MGAGASSSQQYGGTPHWVDPSWESMLAGEWRSERAKELDKLGGKLSVPVDDCSILLR